jgi:hypothetical protein
LHLRFPKNTLDAAGVTSRDEEKYLLQEVVDEVYILLDLACSITTLGPSLVLWKKRAATDFVLTLNRLLLRMVR